MRHHHLYVSIRQHTSAYVSIRQHTSAYVSMRQHASAYVSIRQHTSAYVSIQHWLEAPPPLFGGGTHKTKPLLLILTKPLRAFSGQLGDGTCRYLGEVLIKPNIKHQIKRKAPCPRCPEKALRGLGSISCRGLVILYDYLAQTTASAVAQLPREGPKRFS